MTYKFVPFLRSGQPSLELTLEGRGSRGGHLKQELFYLTAQVFESWQVKHFMARHRTMPEA
jgi:hypothetical protein